MSQISLHMDLYSGLATVSAEETPENAERILNTEGATIGYWSDETSASFATYLSGGRSLEPYLRHGDSRDLVAGLEVELENGKMARTLLTPRSAAGPALRFVLLGRRLHGPTIREVTLRIRALPERSRRKIVMLPFPDQAVAVLRDQVQAKNRPSFFRMYDIDSSESFIGGKQKGCLVLYGYEGACEEVDFRIGRMKSAIDEAGGRELEDAPARVDALSKSAVFPSLFLPDKEQRPEVSIHLSLRWSRIAGMMEDLRRKSGGIYPVATTISGAWHEAALISMQLRSFEGEAEISTIAREVEDLLKSIQDHRAAVLELRYLHGRIDRRWKNLFTDPLTERLFAKP